MVLQILAQHLKDRLLMKSQKQKNSMVMSDKDRGVDEIKKINRLLIYRIYKMTISDKDIAVDDILDLDRASCRDFRQA